MTTLNQLASDILFEKLSFVVIYLQRHLKDGTITKFQIEAADHFTVTIWNDDSNVRISYNSSQL